MNHMIKVAIDGPAGAGKSTVAKLVAERVSFLYIDTGAMYRALTYAAIRGEINLNNGNHLRELLNKLEIRLISEPSGAYVFLGDEDVTENIRGTLVTANVSLVASHERVRTEMVERQRLLAEGGQVVLDGRDIGTYVLPNAEIKIFLTASVKERAKRRYQEQVTKGIASSLEQIEQDITLRDQLDSTRDFAPLRKASDAIVIDSTMLSIEEVAESITELIKERTR